MPVTLNNLANEILLLISETLALADLRSLLLVNRHLSKLFTYRFYEVASKEAFVRPLHKLETALHWAACNGREIVTKKLLDSGADISRKSFRRKTALDFAAERGHEGVVKLFLDQDGVVGVINSQDKAGRTPLYSAAMNGHESIVEMLLDKGAVIAIKTTRKKTALHVAAENGHVGVVKLLIDKGADVGVNLASKAHDTLGRTPLLSAVMNGHEAVVKLLLEFGAHYAIMRRGFGSGTALHWAVQRGYTGIVKLLLEHGADVNTLTREDFTPLHWAAHSTCSIGIFRNRNPVEVVEVLIDNGADIDALNFWHETPLHLAALNGVGKAKVWVSSHPYDYRWKKQRLTLSQEKQAAVQELHISVINLLLEHGADIECKERADHLTSLHQAAGTGDAYLIRHLLAKGADVNLANRWGSTALHMVAYWSAFGISLEPARVLLEYGADINALGEGMTPYEVAVQAGRSDIAELLKAAEKMAI